MTGGTERFEVVLRPEEPYDKEHAELLKKRLEYDGFHDHVVHVRPVGADMEEPQ